MEFQSYPLINELKNQNRMKKIISRFTMKCLRHLFNDKISGLGVYEYKDKYGDKYLANYPFYIWSFRVKK